MKTKAFDYESSFKKSPLVLIPVPWSATVSYGLGTAYAPALIRKASHQLDFFNPLFECSYNDKIHFLKEDPLISSLNSETSEWIKKIRLSKKSDNTLEIINESCQSMLDWVYELALKTINEDKIPGLVGGDHSVSQGLIQAIGEKHKGDFGLLHLDAHADLREAYEGFTYSHASVMFNVLKLERGPRKIIQVAVRDFCKEEYDLIKKEDRIECFFDEWIYSEIFKGQTWAKLTETMVSKLPQQVYVSLDTDALSWTYAPDTGTPVPGGLSFNQVLYLLAELKRQNKKLIGFDVVETGASHSSQESSHRLEWNGNVSARLLYFLSGLALHSFQKI